MFYTNACAEVKSKFIEIFPLFLLDRSYKIRGYCVKSMASLLNLFSVNIRGSLVNRIFALLDDECEFVRLRVVPTLFEISRGSKEFLSSEKVFLALCSVAICDPSFRVRISALEHICLFDSLSQQTIIKCVRRWIFSSSGTKKSYHQKQHEKFLGSTNAGQTNDLYHLQDLKYHRRSPDGVYIDCLEAEMWEVRAAAIRSLFKLAMAHIDEGAFRRSAVDLLIDSLNDNNPFVRSTAIESLIKLFQHANNITLNTNSKTSSNVKQLLTEFENHYFEIADYHLDSIIGALADASHNVRTGLHSLLSLSNYVSPASLYAVICSLIQNIEKFPEDADSTFTCLIKLAFNNSFAIASIAPSLFNNNPLIETAEPCLADTSHIALVILLCNASLNYPAIFSGFPTFYKTHVEFLKRFLPQYVISHSAQLAVRKGSISESYGSQLQEFLSPLVCFSLDNFNCKSHSQITALSRLLASYPLTSNKQLLNVVQNCTNFLTALKNVVEIQEGLNTNTSTSLNKDFLLRLCVRTLTICSEAICNFELSNGKTDVLSTLYTIQIFCLSVALASQDTRLFEMYKNRLLDAFHSLFPPSILDGKTLSDPRFLHLPASINFSDHLTSLKSTNFELKVNAPNFSREIKFHSSRSLKVKVSIRATGTDSLCGIYLEINFISGRRVYYYLGNVAASSHKDGGLDAEFLMYLSLAACTDQGDIKFKLVKFPLKQMFSAILKDYLSKTNHNVTSFIDLTLETRLRLHSYS